MSLVNGCWFRATSSGSGDFTVASAITGYMTPAQADAVDGATYSYRAASDDDSQWEIGTGVYTASGTTLSRTVLKSSNSDSVVTFSAAPKVALTALAADFGGGDANAPVLLHSLDLSDLADQTVAGAAVNFGVYPYARIIWRDVTFDYSGLETDDTIAGIYADVYSGETKILDGSPDGAEFFVGDYYAVNNDDSSGVPEAVSIVLFVSDIWVRAGIIGRNAGIQFLEGAEADDIAEDRPATASTGVNGGDQLDADETDVVLKIYAQNYDSSEDTTSNATFTGGSLEIWGMKV